MLLTQKLIEHLNIETFKNDVIPFIESHYDSTVQTIEFINTI